MIKNLSILAVLAIIVALTFLFRQPQEVGEWRDGDPVLVIVTPHNEAIRYEFEHGFSKWHAARHQRPDGSPQPVRIDWRNVGGTTEISRYLQGQYTTTAKAWWTAQGKAWPKAASDPDAGVTGSRPPSTPELLEAFKAYREVDRPDAITSGVDLFFGGGFFDHSGAVSRGYAVEPWTADNLPPEVARSLELIPTSTGGETWRTPAVFGNAISTFGIVYNVDRLRELGIPTPPTAWKDLADYRYVGQVGVTDPTKSGSIAKAFEMLVHQQMFEAARTYLTTRGVPDDRIAAAVAANEATIDAHRRSRGPTYQRGDVPDDLAGYQAALEQGWLDGIALIQAVGANARYFTDSATKVSLDISIGDAAVGMSIDFYGRYQAQSTRAPDGTDRMKFVTPVGGTSVSCDPISLLRGAPNRALACEFITFVLSADGQRIWTYAPGAKNESRERVGNEKYALRRLPIRRDFYASTQPAIEAAHLEHKQHAIDDLADPNIDPYQVAKQFTYYPRWTGEHFGVMREITRAMCMDSGEELRAAWHVLHRQADPDLSALRKLPVTTLHDASGASREVPITWRTAPTFRSFDPLEVQREWTEAFRRQYRAIAHRD